MDDRSTEPSQDETAGAGPNERLLHAAKQDSEELFLEVEEAGGYDINFQDGLGNTALHYAVMNVSPYVLDMILEEEGADVDLLNKRGQTPLLAAIEISSSESRLMITRTLLEAGANPRIRNPKTGQKPLEILISKTQSNSGGASAKNLDQELVEALKEAEAKLELDADDIVDDGDEADHASAVDSDDVASD